MRRLGRLDGRHIESRHHRIEPSVDRSVADIRGYRGRTLLSDTYPVALSVEAAAMDRGRRRARVFHTLPYFRQDSADHDRGDHRFTVRVGILAALPQRPNAGNTRGMALVPRGGAGSDRRIHHL